MYVSKDSVFIIYLWSYRGQYPIAEILFGNNSTYSEVEKTIKNTFGVSSLNALSEFSIPNETLLRNGRLQEALPEAQITTYTYKPLLGLTSQTDPRGITTFYDYDGFGRLKEVYYNENNKKKVLESYDYHYKNQ
jgi:YD repeat-containing protein